MRRTGEAIEGVEVDVSHQRLDDSRVSVSKSSADETTSPGGSSRSGAYGYWAKASVTILWKKRRSVGWNSASPLGGCGALRSRMCLASWPWKRSSSSSSKSTITTMVTGDGSRWRATSANGGAGKALSKGRSPVTVWRDRCCGIGGYEKRINRK